MSLLGKLFPETLFARRLSSAMQHRLRLAQARAEEALTQTHVDNALYFMEMLSPEVPYDRAIDIYVRELGVPDPLAGVITTRALVTLGERESRAEADTSDESQAEQPTLPHLRLDDADVARKRA
jgi:hypothetical protein